MSFRIAYAPRFGFFVPPANPFRPEHGEVLVRVHKHRAFSVEEERQLTLALEAFPLLADTGALAGVDFPPPGSGVDDYRVTSSVRSTDLVLVGPKLDARASNVLLSLLLGHVSEGAVERVVIEAPAAGPPARAEVDEHQLRPYPTRRDDVAPPFALDVIETESEVVQVWATLTRPATASEHDLLAGPLLAWGAVASVGAYGLPPVEPSACGCLPNPTVTVRGPSLEWRLTRARFHPGAIDGLVQVFENVHARVGIQALEIA